MFQVAKGPMQHDDVELGFFYSILTEPSMAAKVILYSVKHLKIYLTLNSLSPHDASKHYFSSLKNYLIS